MKLILNIYVRINIVVNILKDFCFCVVGLSCFDDLLDCLEREKS